MWQWVSPAHRCLQMCYYCCSSPLLYHSSFVCIKEFIIIEFDALCIDWVWCIDCVLIGYGVCVLIGYGVLCIACVLIECCVLIGHGVLIGYQLCIDWVLCIECIDCIWCIDFVLIHVYLFYKCSCQSSVVFLYCG